MKVLKANTHVLVCDGANALLLKNVGDAITPKLSVVHSQKQSVPPTRELGRDAPPRVFQRVGAKRSSVERPDLHDLQEERFARDIAKDIEARLSSDEIEALIVAAPPRFLADLRKFFPNSVRKVIVAELAKNLTNLPTKEIEDYIVVQLA
jgi:protein required for attachment to host cells